MVCDKVVCEVILCERLCVKDGVCARWWLRDGV